MVLVVNDCVIARRGGATGTRSAHPQQLCRIPMPVASTDVISIGPVFIFLKGGARGTTPKGGDRAPPFKNGLLD